MKKLLLFICGLMLSVSTFAQMPNGSIAPDWTLVDLDGVEHNMYSYLDDGYTVIIDFSAVWCGPCWSYHTGGALEELYINHGPAGYPNVSANTTDDVMVFFIEGDQGTLDELNGIGSGTAGNWVEGTPYPIIPTYAPNGNQVTSDYQIGYWPTIYMVCPNRIINENSQISTAAHYALAQDCPPLSTTVNDVNILGINTPSGTNCSASFIPEIKLQNYGTENLTSVELVSYVDDVEQNTFTWNGDIVQYEVEVLALTEIVGAENGDHVYKIIANNPNMIPDEDPTNNTLTSDFTTNTDGKEIVVNLLTDNYPGETSWDLFYDGTVVASGAGYGGAQTLYETPLCVDGEQCYTFTIYDEYGDGMSYGGVTGHVSVTWGGTIMGEIPGDGFTTEGSFDFCVMGVGVDDNVKKNINIYPNPTTGIINIDGAEGADVAVYSITGKLIGEYNGSEKVDLSIQPNGIYFVKVYNDSFVTTKRITLNR